MSTAPFSDWNRIYVESVGELSKNTWHKGILLEIKKKNIKSGTVLDLGGGNGTGSDLLQSIGSFQVTALDKSQPMLDLNNTSTIKIKGDFLEIGSLTESYDLIVSGFDSFNYLKPDLLTEFFKSMSKILNRDGLFIFDYSSPKFLSNDWSDTEFSQDVADGRLDWKTKFDADESRCDIRLEYWKDGKREWDEAHSQYTVNAYQMSDALSGSTLSIEYVRDLNAETFSPQANTHVYIVRRNPAE